MEKIDELRLKINDIDDQLLQLLNERAECAVAIGKTKSQTQKNVVDPDREQQILERVCKAVSPPLQKKHVMEIFKTIFAQMIDLQKQ